MECVAEEEPWLRAHAVAPGVVDTDMQAVIRATSPDVFPSVERFRALTEQDAFNTPEWVAGHVLALATGPRRDEVVIRIADEPR